MGMREKGPDLPRASHLVRAEYCEGIPVPTFNNSFHFGGSHGNFKYMALTELHLHLEGTIDRETVLLLDPSVSRADVDAAWSFSDFAGFIRCFKFAAQRLRGPEDYALVTRRMMQSLGGQDVEYAEVTLSAGVVLWREMHFGEVWNAIRQAQKEAFREWPVEIWWNFDAIRQFGPEHVMQVARVAAEYVDDGVISFGIGGDEVAGPVRLFRDAYRYAKDAGLRLTAHAGETDGPESVKDALGVGAERIGHGIRAIDDPDLIRRLRDEQIPLEVCISSNVRTGAVATLAAHPVRRLFDAGVPITLNTDDPGIFESGLDAELAIARRVFGFTELELEIIETTARRFRFAR